MAHETALNPSVDDVLRSMAAPLRWCVGGAEVVLSILGAFGAYLSLGFGVALFIVVLAIIDSFIPQPVGEVKGR